MSQSMLYQLSESQNANAQTIDYTHNHTVPKI